MDVSLDAIITAALNGGGFVVLVAFLIFGGRFASRQIERMQRLREKHDGMVLEVLAGIRDSLTRAEVERVRAVAELRIEIERSAKETRHSLRNDLQVLAVRLADVPCTEPDEADGPHVDRSMDGRRDRKQEREKERT